MVDAVSRPERRTLTLGLTGTDVLVGVVLVVILLIGGYFRFTGRNWDDFVRFHPDERFLSGIVSALNGPLAVSNDFPQEMFDRCLERYPETGGRGGFFDAECSAMNPNNIPGGGLYVYGTLPSFFVRWMADTTINLLNFQDCVNGDVGKPGSGFWACLTGQATATPTQIAANSVWGQYSGVHLIGRTLSAIAEMGVILTVFFIGVQLHDKWVGLLAAALYSFTVFSIQQAHFWTTDATTNLFVTLAILFVIRAQDKGRWLDYLLFGLMYGAALASRINTLPLAGLLLVAVGLRILPALDSRLAWSERGRLVTPAIVGLISAGVGTFLAFRLGNPYAFVGPGFFGLTPNQRWLEDMAQAQYLVSGKAESPPNWQWVGRTPYLFPFSNMVLWGMGLFLGLAGWLSWLWSGWRLVRGKPGALRNILPFIWVLGYFGWLGRLWVMSMRYYLPLYPILALFAAWGLVELVRRSGWARSTVWAWMTRLLLFSVVVFTGLWALMFTNIYRHLFTPAAASYWIGENVPADFSMRVEGAPSGTPLINIAVVNPLGGGDDTSLELQASRYEEGSTFIAAFTAPADGTITTVFSPHLGSLSESSQPSMVHVAISGAGSDVVLTESTLTDRFSRDNHVLGNAYDIPLDTPLVVRKGETYSFMFEVLEGGPIISAGSVFTWEGDWDEPVPPKVCDLPLGVTLVNDPPSGLSGPRDCNGHDLWSAHLNGYKLQVYWEEEEYKRERFQKVLDDTEYLIIGTNRRYDSQSRIPYRWPMTLRYYDTLFDGSLGFELVATFQQTYEFGPFRVSDQYLPTYSAPEWLNEFEAEEAFHVYDHPVVFIFRKAETYSSDNTKAILNRVSLNKADAVTGSFNNPLLVGVVPLYSLPANDAPTQLSFTPEMLTAQYTGGTWSERFDSDSVVNTQPVVTIVMWWVVILIFGWAAWPLLFTLFPGLPDRGYGFAKISGLVLVSWLAWFVSSARIPMWSQSGIALALLALLAVSLVLGWRSRAELSAYVRQYAARLFWIDVITLIAFIFFLMIRLTNPDLWHPSFGGEKPMDFAYFNGVLRSTIFPPIDPWHAGGYLNYYYFGYVIVGAPVLLLGVIPSIAYNLIIPTLFALTGIGAFSVAFNLVSALRESPNTRRQLPEVSPQIPPANIPLLASEQQSGEDAPLPVNEPESESSLPSNESVIVVAAPPTSAKLNSIRLGSPWVAGIAALLLAVVLGNLDTPRVFIAEALTKTGFYQNSIGLQTYLINEYTQSHNNTSPEGDEMTRIVDQAIRESSQLGTSILRGLSRMLKGEPLDIAPNRWYWAPTRTSGEALGTTDIHEIPFFTFLYGDLHAHMIAMPMLLMVMGFVLNEVLLAGRDPRQRLAETSALAVGGLMVGLLRATNTWDWITFILLSILGLGYAWWLAWKRINRRSLVNFVLRVGAFVLFSLVFSLPYSTWYASVYTRVVPFQGKTTPLWVYVTVHGMFLFLVFSLLVWETGRWLRSVYVRSLRGTWPLLAAGVVVILTLLVSTVLLAAGGYPIVLVAVPLLLWTVILFFRAGQVREMQYVLALVGLALCLTIGVEFIVIEGDIQRQNTIFKFYIQAWLLFSVTGGAAVAWLLQGSSRWSLTLRSLWYPVAGLLFLMTALYPLMASRGRAQDRMADVPLTLDGAAYMQYAMHYEGDPILIQQNPTLAPFSLADDYQLIRWLQENVQGSPVIMEGQSDREYRWEGRISIYTGLPSVIGWNWHQRQQRTFDPMPRLVQQRVANVNAFYTTTDIPMAWDILRHYDVSYVIVGKLEQAYYSPDGLRKFERMADQGLLEIAYQNGGTTIYQVNKDAGFVLEEGV